MRGFFKKISSFFNDLPNQLSFDSMNKEYKATTPLNEKFIGSRVELNAQLTNQIQLTTSFLPTAPDLINFTCIYRKPNLVSFTTIDQDKSYHAYVSATKYGFLLKAQSMISKKKGVFSEIEVGKSSQSCNFGYRFIRQAAHKSPAISIFNFCKKIKNLYFGNEIIVENGKSTEIGVSVSMRHESDNNVFFVGLQQFTALNFMYFRQFSHNVGGCVDFRHLLVCKKSEMSAALKVAGKMINFRTSIDTTGVVVSLIEAKINDRLFLTISNEVDFLDKNCGLGISMSLYL